MSVRKTQHHRGKRLVGVAATISVALGLTAYAVPPAMARTQAPVVKADPVSVSFTLEGCRNDGTITLPIGGL
ncbi:MAG: hypothetical protein ACKOYQ_12485, partial [Actinomycetota bacterium]